MSDSSKPSWRKAGKGTGRRADPGGKGWQAKRTTAANSSVFAHRAKLLALGLATLGLLAYFAIKVFFVPERTPLFIAAVTNYPQLPPNRFAHEDVQTLLATNAANLRVIEPCIGEVTRDRLLKFLDEHLRAAPGGPAGSCVVLFLSAHGVVNEKAEPCLLLSDSGPTDALTWLRVADLFEVLKRRRASELLLILDAAQIDDEWSLGILRNGFTEQLEKLVTEAALPKLHVLSAASGGERAWSAPELDGSVFGHYIARGLEDAASRDDNRVTLRELATYVSRQVSAWVRKNRASSQTPKLLTALPADRDIALAFRGVPAQSQTTDRWRAVQARMTADAKEIGGLWKELEQRVQTRQLARYAPVTMARTQRLMLRLEQLSRAGTAYRAEFEATRGQVRTLLDTDPRGALPSALEAYSLPLRHQLLEPPKPDPARQAVFARWLEANGKPPLKEGEKPLPPFEYAVAAEFAARFAREAANVDRRPLRDVLQLVDESTGHRNAKGDRLSDVCEVLFARMLDREVDAAEPVATFPAHVRLALPRVLAARDAAEQAVAPNDERTHYFAQTAVDAGDVSRRLAEDALFCDRSGAESEMGLASFQSASAATDEVAAMLKLRDEIWMGLPYLAAWAERLSEMAGARPLVARDAVLSAAQKLAVGNHELGSFIDRAVTDERFDLTAARTKQAELRAAWTELRAAFTGCCQQLCDRSGQDKPTWLEIDEVLRVPGPLVAADERERLTARYLNILFAEAAMAEADASAEVTAGTNPDRKVAVGAELHLAVQILDRAALPLMLNRRTPDARLERGGDNDVAWLARQGERVRRWLADVTKAADDLEDETNQRLAQGTESVGNLRAGVSEADRLVRAAAPWVTAEVKDPALRLRRLDRHFQFLWLARRTLDDFWGPLEANGDSYFASVADAYLRNARLLDDTPKDLRHNGVNLGQLLAQRRDAAIGTRILSGDVATRGQSESIPHRGQVAWHSALPAPGTVAFSIEKPSAEGDGLLPVTDAEAHVWRRRPLSVGESAAESVSYSLPVGKLLETKQNVRLSSVLRFRGHRMQQPFEIQFPKATLVATVEPIVPRTAKITVFGEASRRAFVVFVFDCSRSMEKEGRITLAKDSLRQVIDALQIDEHYHVGLWAYGRTAGFDRAGKQVFDQNGQDTNRDPNTDVERLIEVAPLTLDHHSAITKRFGELKPLGVTPLYLAIKTVLQSDDFVLARPDDIKQIIVLSDGVNEQTKDLSTHEEVIRTIRENPRAANVRVDVVLFQEALLRGDAELLTRLKARGTSVDREIQNVKDLTKETGGAYFAAEHPKQLVETMRRLLRLVKYSVSPEGATSPPPEAEHVELGRPWPLRDLSGKPQRYQVQLHGASRSAKQSVTIEGGEALELQFDKAADQLVFRLFAPRDHRELIESLVDPKSKETFRVVPILPMKDVRRVTFQIGMQNMDRQRFTFRPEHVWTVITPQSGAGQPVAPAYHFYDAQFVPDRSVPVLQFIVTDWPTNAPQASIRMWLNFDQEPLKSNGEQRVDALKPAVVTEDIPDADFTTEIKQTGDGARGWQLTVQERHPIGSELYTARVQATPLADRVTHRFFVGLNEVEHVFDYAAQPVPTVVITSNTRVIQGALVVPSFTLRVEE